MTSRHKRLWRGVVSVLAVMLLLTTASGTEKQGEASDLRILFAGHPGSEREQDFVEFLRAHFKTVGTTDLKQFNESQTDGYDVTILDYDGDLFRAPQPRLSQGFSRPLVTVGVPGAFMCSHWRLKTGYL